MDAYYNFARLILRIYKQITAQECHVGGELELSPGPKIIAANHPNATDFLYLPFLFQEKLHFLIQGNLFSIPLIGWLLTKSDQIPVRASEKGACLEQSYNLLVQGKTVVIFPEGRLNPNHQSIKAGTGAVRLSLMTGARIIPVGFYVPDEYVHNIIQKGNNQVHQGRWQTHGRCYIQIGSPWLPGQELCGRAKGADYHELTTQLMQRIDSLTHLAILDYANENHSLWPIGAF